MKKIFKYKLQVVDSQIIQMPKGSDVLTTQPQHGIPCIWALIDEDQPPEDIEIIIKGTGHPADNVNIENYIGTCQLYNGDLVFHVFSRKIRSTHENQR